MYDSLQDGRRRAARKRNVEELELKRDALDTILEALRQSDDRHVQHLLDLIRSDAPLDDIIQCASANGQNIPEEQLASIAVAMDTGMSRKSVLTINALCDATPPPPPIMVSADPWTYVTSDDDFVSHLISIYFTWVHPAYPIVVHDVFIEAMLSGQVDIEFCSPLLVNAMLAVACVSFSRY